MRFTFICIFLLCLSRASAQPEDFSTKWWVSFNGGVVPESNFSLSADLNIPTNHSTFLFLMGDYRSDFRGDLSERYENMGTSLGFGKWIEKRAFIATLSTGLSMDLVIEDGNYIQNGTNGTTYYTTAYGIEFGLPIRLSALLKSKWVGLGIHALYKLTLYDSYGSIGISLAFGRFA